MPDHASMVEYVADELKRLGSVERTIKSVHRVYPNFSLMYLAKIIYSIRGR